MNTEIKVLKKTIDFLLAGMNEITKEKRKLELELEQLKQKQCPDAEQDGQDA